jgi:type II secretory pathway pseudopilin PulG
MPSVTPSSRGYLLLEAAIGGAIVAVIIGGLLTSLSQAQTMSIISARDQTATQLVNEKLDERRALGFANVTAQTAAVVVGVTGEFTRQTTVTACTETVPAPGTNIPCKDITVSVSFVAGANASTGAGGTRTVQATARVYQ